MAVGHLQRIQRRKSLLQRRQTQLIQQFRNFGGRDLSVMLNRDQIAAVTPRVHKNVFVAG